jgi:hypothetical protein
MNNQQSATGRKLPPEMVRALTRGWADNGATCTGLIRRGLARMTSEAHDIRLTAMGKQWASHLALLAKAFDLLGRLAVEAGDGADRFDCGILRDEIRKAAWP